MLLLLLFIDKGAHFAPRAKPRPKGRQRPNHGKLPPGPPPTAPFPQEVQITDTYTLENEDNQNIRSKIPSNDEEPIGPPEQTVIEKTSEQSELVSGKFVVNFIQYLIKSNKGQRINKK